MPDTANKRWYLVQCKPRQDLRALEHLQRQGYECMLPLHEVERLKRGTWCRKEEPLFPGYLFIELDTQLDNWMPIRSTRGVSQIVRFGDKSPPPIPNEIIYRIRNQETPRVEELKAGEKVIFYPLGTSGVEAIFLAKDGTERVFLLLKLLQREIQTRVPIKCLAKY